MSPRFLDLWDWLMEWEGRTFENDPDDPGGATRWGVDQRSHPHEDIRNLTERRAMEIYWNEYWQKNNCEERAKPFGEVFFNCCVNAGRGRADKIVAAGGSSAKAFLDEQDAFYDRLAQARPASRKFLRGWHNRVASLRKKLGIA